MRFLAAQYTERDGVEHRLIAGCFGIFGHGNVAGIGQALLEAELATRRVLPYRQARNEQAMVHTAAGFARMRNRLRRWRARRRSARARPTWSPAPRWPRSTGCRCCCCPATSSPPGSRDPVLQELERPAPATTSASTTRSGRCRAFFDRVWRPEQLPSALLGAMRVLTDPAETGAVTIALPQDVQAEAFDWPDELFARRVWHVARPVARAGARWRAAVGRCSGRRGGR